NGLCGLAAAPHPGPWAPLCAHPCPPPGALRRRIFPPRARDAGKDANAQQDRGADRHIQLGYASGDEGPGHAPDEDQKADEIEREGHGRLLVRMEDRRPRCRRPPWQGACPPSLRAPISTTPTERPDQKAKAPDSVKNQGPSMVLAEKAGFEPAVGY